MARRLASGGQSPWADRIARARLLADTRSSAAELLTFYIRLAEFQQALVAGGDDDRVEPRSAIADRLVDGIDIERVLDAIPPLFDWLSRTAPARLDVAEVLTVPRDEWREAILARLAAPDHAPCGLDAAPGFIVASDDPGPSPVADDDRLSTFVVEAVLQPFVEQCAAKSAVQSAAQAAFPMRCPYCASLPVVAVLREEGHGARRLLSCGLCLREWECGRIVCPACGEQEFERLPVYTAEQFTHARIEACDRCRRYVKAIDLSKDGHAIPFVDDIASVALDLWARERGYVRLKRNLLGF